MSTSEQAPPEEQTLSGAITGVIMKNADTWQVAVMPEGSQYTKNLWTKDADLVTQMQQMIGQQATFFCNVSHWTRQDGQPVRSLWINGWTQQNGSGGQGGMTPIGDEVTQAQAALMAARARQAQQQAQREQQPLMPQEWMPQQAQQGTTQTPAQQQFVSQDVKELRIMREAADKCAARVLAAIIQAGGLKEEDLTTVKLHGFMDSFANRRVLYYETGQGFYEDDIPFMWEDGHGRDPGVHFDPWR
jgi:hypothetical protein